MIVGLDVAGGDFAPDANIEGAILAREEIGDRAGICLIGDENVIRESLAKHGGSAEDFEIAHAPEVIGMGEHPTKAFLKKPESSLAVGFKLLQEGKINAFSSTGNSGAMLVGSMYTIRTIPGDRKSVV